MAIKITFCANFSRMIKIGVLGAGHLGKIHLKCIKQIAEYELVGFYDPDEQNAIKVEEELGLKRFEDASSLIDAVEVVDIVTPTISHFECAAEAIKKVEACFYRKADSYDFTRGFEIN